MYYWVASRPDNCTQIPAFSIIDGELELKLINPCVTLVWLERTGELRRTQHKGRNSVVKSILVGRDSTKSVNSTISSLLQFKLMCIYTRPGCKIIWYLCLQKHRMLAQWAYVGRYLFYCVCQTFATLCDPFLELHAIRT